MPSDTFLCLPRWCQHLLHRVAPLCSKEAHSTVLGSPHHAPLQQQLWSVVDEFAAVGKTAQEYSWGCLTAEERVRSRCSTSAFHLPLTPRHLILLLPIAPLRPLPVPFNSLHLQKFLSFFFFLCSPSLFMQVAQCLQTVIAVSGALWGSLCCPIIIFWVGKGSKSKSVFLYFFPVLSSVLC